MRLARGCPYRSNPEGGQDTILRNTGYDSFSSKMRGRKKGNYRAQNVTGGEYVRLLNPLERK